MSSNVAIGIDLGTTNSCVAVVRHGRVEIIANEQGSRITPSVVAFTDTQRLVGEAAKAQAIFNPQNTVYEAKRLIGRKFDDASLQNDIKHWPFEVQNIEGNPKIVINFKGEQKVFTPEEISAMVLSEMKEIAETYLGHPVQDAVITVPAYFNDSQRQATIDAGTIAGLNVLKIINEPTAAAIAYGVDKRVTDKSNVLIYDLGGGTFDVVVMSIENGNFEVKAVSGNTHLGGGDFDNRVVDHFVRECSVKQKLDVAHDKSSLAKLRKAGEDAKRNLSASLNEHIGICALHQGVDFCSRLTRSRFENLCSDLFSATIDYVQTVLSDSGLDKEEVHEVILAGGSTRIPKVRQLLQDFFQGKKLNMTINPDEAVASGAALHAAKLSGENSLEEFYLTDVTPMTLGVSLINDKMSKIIPRNTKIPTTIVRKNYTTASVDYQNGINFGVYEGEEKKASLNNRLGNFVAEGIEIAPVGVPKVDITFEIDVNGILHASAVDAKTGCTSGVSITCNKGRLRKEDITRMVVETQKYSACNMRQKEIDVARSTFEKFIFQMKSSIEQKRFSGDLSRIDAAMISEACEEALLWVEKHESSPKEEYDEKKKELEEYCSVIISEDN